MAAPVQSIIVNGSAAILVDIECRLSNNLPTIVIVGLANRAVGESRERIRGAFATSRIMLPRKRITVNLAPADIPKADSSFDLAIAVAIMRAGGQIGPDVWRGRPAFIGEIGLDGGVRAVRGIIGKILAGRGKGITTFFIPSANLGQARLVPNVRLVPVPDLSRLYRYLSGAEPCEPCHTGKGGRMPSGADLPETSSGVLLSEIAGQQQAKRALEIAAAGGHNILLDGPPGTGKSMLARALPGLLPPLDREEMLEVTHLHSLAGHDYGRIVTARPFRAPHHGASLASIIGGGRNFRPGEISLAHRGVLLFDELPEFSRDAVETLRQPLETRTISVVRAHGTAKYPANFIFAATANPCPCGYFSSGRPCRCPEWSRRSYRNRLSGPVFDRIDLYGRVHDVKYDRLMADSGTQADTDARRRVRQARDRQKARFRTGTKLNADMTNADVRNLPSIEPEALSMLNRAAREYGVSARAYMRILKVARTIADLESSETVCGPHLAEALKYRPDFAAGTADV